MSVLRLIFAYAAQTLVNSLMLVLVRTLGDGTETGQAGWTGAMVVICVLFDYLLPFTVLGCAAMFRKPADKLRENNRVAGDALLLAGFVLVVVFRFACHYVTGFSIWGQWAPEGQSKFIYSLIYNCQYMLPECIFTTIGAAVMIGVPVIRKQLGIKDK